MKIEEARAIGAVRDYELVSVEPLINDGVAIVPRGVTKVSFKSLTDYHLKVVFLPDTVTEFVHGSGMNAFRIATYQGNEPSSAPDYDDCLQDLRYIQHYDQFPPFDVYVWRPYRPSYTDSPESLLLRILVHPNFTYETIEGGNARVELNGKSDKYEVIDGALYDKEIRTLLYYPQTPMSENPIELPSSVETIGARAFCHALISDLTLNSNVRSIMPEAFYFAHANRITLSPQVELISHDVGRFGRSSNETEPRGPFCHFWGKEVVLYEGMKEIVAGAFYRAAFLAQLALPDSITKIGDCAFQGCSELSLVVPESVADMPPSSYRGVQSISLPASFAKRWKDYLFDAGGAVVAIRDKDGGYAIAYYLPQDGISDYKRERIRGDNRWSILDEFFADNSIKGLEDRIKVALTRLCCVNASEAKPSDEMIETYRAYVKRNKKKALTMFEETKDTVCISMLEYLGHSTSAIKSEIKKASAKEKKPSVAELCNSALDALKIGDSSKLDDLKPLVSKIRPAVAMQLLMRAAAKGDEHLIDELYEMFGSFEMPGLALSRAIAFGNESTARALLKHGVKLGVDYFPICLKGDTDAKRRNREKKYKESILQEDALDIPGRRGYYGRYFNGYIYFMTLSDASDELLEELAQEGVFDEEQLKMLTIAAIADTNVYFRSDEQKTKLARSLYKAGGNNDKHVWINMQDGKLGHWRRMTDYKDLLFVGCDIDTVKAVCSIMPERVNDMWIPGMVRYPETVSAMLPHLDPEKFSNTVALLNAFAKEGYTAQIKQMAERGFDLTDKALSHAAILASDNGHTETMATILSLKQDDGEKSSSSSLML